MTAAPKPPVADIAAMKPTGEVYGCVASNPTDAPTPNLDRVEQLRNAVGPGGGLRVGRRFEEMRRKDGRRC
jgi:hypothetical protein